MKNLMGKKCCRWEEMQCLCITRLISPPFLFVEHMKAHEWIWALWRVVYVCQGRAPYVWVKYVLMLESHVLPDSMVTNPPFFANISTLVSSGRDYTGLDNLPEADMHSFIKNPNGIAHSALIQPKCTNYNTTTGVYCCKNVCKIIYMTWLLWQDCCVMCSVFT